MKTIKTILIIGVVAVLIIAGFSEEAFAMHPPPPSAPSSVPYSPPVPPSVYAPPSAPLPMPSPQYLLKKWSIDDVVKSFNEYGLEIMNIKPIEEADYNPLPARAKEGIKFSTPSFGEYAVGYILSFETKGDMEKVKKHYLKLNKKGELYTWVFVKDNIFLALAGTVPEDKAREYERTLYNLKK